MWRAGPRSRRRPLSATQHHPTTSLVGISWYCNELWRSVSSILTTFRLHNPLNFKYLQMHFFSMTYKKSKKIKQLYVYNILLWYKINLWWHWKGNVASHWITYSFYLQVLLPRTEEEGSGRRRDRSPCMALIMASATPFCFCTTQKHPTFEITIA